MDPSTTMQHHWHRQGVELLYLSHHLAENSLLRMDFQHSILDQRWNTSDVIKCIFPKRELNVFVTQSLFTLTFVTRQCYNL